MPSDEKVVRGGRTEEGVECFEELACVRCAVDLVVEV